MDNQDSRSFLASFVPCFGGYVVLHFVAAHYGYDALEFMVALAAIPALLMAWGLLRSINRPLARGFIASLGAIFIFLFTFGGCGLLRVY